MREIKFFVPGMPQTAGSKRAFINPKTGRPIITDDNKKGKPWRATAQVFATQVTKDLLQGPILATFCFYMPRPKGHYNSKGEVKSSAPRYPTTKPDALKMARAIEDALTGICYSDDSNIVDEILSKRYADNGKLGCLVELRELD